MGGGDRRWGEAPRPPAPPRRLERPQELQLGGGGGTCSCGLQRPEALGSRRWRGGCGQWGTGRGTVDRGRTSPGLAAPPPWVATPFSFRKGQPGVEGWPRATVGNWACEPGPGRVPLALPPPQPTPRSEELAPLLACCAQGSWPWTWDGAPGGAQGPEGCGSQVRVVPRPGRPQGEPALPRWLSVGWLPRRATHGSQHAITPLWSSTPQESMHPGTQVSLPSVPPGGATPRDDLPGPGLGARPLPPQGPCRPTVSLANQSRRDPQEPSFWGAGGIPALPQVTGWGVPGLREDPAPRLGEAWLLLSALPVEG